MLTIDTITPFLLERGLVDLAWIVGGHLTIREAARRNRNIQVNGPNGTGLFLKQPDPSAERGHDSLRREADFYRLCRELPAISEVLRFLPRMIHDDYATATSVFELIHDAVPIRTLINDELGHDITLDATGAIGQTLGTVHRIFGAAFMSENLGASGLTSKLPWMLSLHKPKPEMLSTLSAASLETLRIVQTDRGTFDRLEALRREWENKTVIHGDIKFDHFLIDRAKATPNHAGPPVWIVDWETVGIGDPACDLAGALHDFLVNWVLSMPLSDGMNAAEISERAAVPLADLRKLSRAMWSGYRAGANLSATESDRLLLRAVKYSAARLIQSAFEISQEAERVPGRAVILLQLSANLLAEPELGQMQLYGIPVGSLVS